MSSSTPDTLIGQTIETVIRLFVLIVVVAVLGNTLLELFGFPGLLPLPF